MISRDTATRIARAYAEIEAGEKLLEDFVAEAKRVEAAPPELRRGFNQSDYRYGIEIGVRVNTGMRCFDVHPNLAAQVIRAHIKAKCDELARLNKQALEEAQS